MELGQEVINYLNANQPLLLGLAGLLSIVIQYAVNHIKGLGRLTNAVLGLVAIPGVVTAVLAAGTSVHATQYPVVVILSQLAYHVYENLKNSATAQAQAEVVSQTF